MLQTILNNISPPQCVVIYDTLEAQGKNILFSMIKNHLRIQIPHIHVFVFENNPEKIKNMFPKANIYDFTSGKIDDNRTEDFLKVLEEKKLNGVIVIDSLTHVILEYGLAETYRALHKLINNSTQNIIQLSTTIHEDVVDNQTQIYIQKLAILSMKLHPMSTNKHRVDYLYKKPGGTIIKELEEYYFIDGVFCTKTIEKIDPKIHLANTTNEKSPEDLATFKIGLNQNDRRLRDNFELPYLKTSEEPENVGGFIEYNLDDIDDWDEEDPDDDLDI